MAATLSIDNVTLMESDAGTQVFVFTVSLDQTASEDITVVADTSGVSATGGGVDFADVTAQTLTILAGQTSTTVIVDVTGEDLAEIDETFTVDLSDARIGGVTDPLGVTIGDSQGLGTIINDDTATLSINDVILAEGNSGTTAFVFTVSIDRAASEDIAVVADTSGVSAVGGGFDFADVTRETLTILAGQTSTTVTVNVNAGNLVEIDETFTVDLSDVRIGGVADANRVTIGDGQGLGTIANDDTATLSINDVSLAEGDSGTTAFVFTVSIDKAASQDITVVADTSGVSAVGGGFDFADVTGETLTILAGQTSTTVTVNVNAGNLVEIDETFTVDLSDVRIGGVTDSSRATIGDGQGLGTIINDDTGLSIAASDAVKNEGDAGTTAFTFTVTRSGQVAGVTTTVDYLVDHEHGLAQAHEPDFKNGVLPSGQLTFAPGQVSKTITVDVVGETLGEVDEGFTIRLANPSSDATLIQKTADGIILNDDAPTMSIFALDAVMDEGDSGTTPFTFAVTRSGDVAGATSMVDYEVALAPGANMADLDDFGGSQPTGTVIFNSGQTLEIITIDVSGDSDRELSELFSVSLSNAGGGTIGIGAAGGTIVDDDSLNSLTFTDFSDVSDLTLNGDAIQSGSVLRLTPDTYNQAGSAFFNLPATVGGNTSFSTDFRFQIGGGTDGADGFTFLVQNDPRTVTALGDRGSSLGYDDLVSAGDSVVNSLAVEFDVYDGGGYDPSDNHIAVLINGDVTSPDPATQVTLDPGIFDLNDGTAYKAWIDYNVAGTDLLEIYLDGPSGGYIKPTAPVLSTAVQLDGALGGANAYVGFTAGTGGRTNSHDILDWSLNMNPTANLTYRADASAFEVSGGSSSTGTANAGLVLSDDQATLDYVIDVSALNLEEIVGDRTGDLDVTRVTLRVGTSGSDESTDPIVLTIFDAAGGEDDLTVDWDRDILSGRWDADDASVLADYADELAGGDMYVFVETADPASDNDIRGQISNSALTFYGVADAGEIVPNGGSIPEPDPTNPATAVVAFNLNAAGTEIEYFIDIDGLTLTEDRVADEDGEVWGIHLHRGAPGFNGSHALNIFGSPMKGAAIAEDDDDLFIDYDEGVLRGTWGDAGDNILGGMMGSDALQDVLDEVLAGDIYVQIHAIDELGEDTKNIRAQISVSDNLRPNSPIITEPPAPGTESHFTDVHMEAPFFIDPDGDEHLYTDFEIWTVNGSEMVWDGRTMGNFEKIHAHFADGEFVGSSLGDNQLQPATDYVLRARYIDEQGAYSDYSETPFFTSPANAIVALTTADVLGTPTPTWEESGTGDTTLDPGQFIELRAEDDSLLVRFDHTGVTDDPGELPSDLAIKAVVDLNGEAASNFTFETVETGEQTISLAANAQGTYWVSTSGTTYNDQALSDIAQGTLKPYRAVQEGFEVELAHEPSAGLQLAVDIAFVPQEVYDTYITDPNAPGYDGSKPLYYVSELFGTIKEFTLDGTMHEYVPATLPGSPDFETDNASEVRVKGLLNYAPGDSISGASEQGVGGLTVVENDSGGLDVYVGYLYSESGTQFARLVKLTDTDGDHVVDIEDTIVDFGPTKGRAGEDTVTGEEIARTWTNPAEQGQSHFISDVSIRDDEIYLHMGDGFDSATAQDLNEFLGKILRFDLDGMPIATPGDENPFYDDTDGLDATDFIWTYGYRNPFGGDWREADDSHYVIENGQSINDRLSKSEIGVNYGWTGNGGFFGEQDTMTTNAIYNWVPTEAPVDIAFIQDGTYGGSSFPEEMRDMLFATLSGPTFANGVPVFGGTGEQRGKQIAYFDLEDAVGGDTPLVPGVESGPDVLVNYVGIGRGSFSGIASGPDGLYFLSLYDDLNENTGDKNNNPVEVGAQVFRVRYEALEIAADDADRPEDETGPFTFTVTRQGDLTRETTVEYQVLGGASNPADASDFGGALPTGLVTFAFGEDTQTIEVNVQPDTINELHENFRVHLFGASSGQILDADATGVIRNDDTPTLSISAVDAVKAEGTGGTTPFTFDVTRGGDPSATLTVDWEVVLGGTASAADFGGPLGGTIVGWADALPRTITIDVAADALVELDEDFTVELISAPGAVIAQPSAAGTITNDDTATLSINDVTLSEGDSGTTAFVFTVSLDKVASEDITVVTDTSGVSAAGGGVDFADVTGQTLTILAEELSTTVTVEVTGEDIPEIDEMFTLNLSDARIGGVTDPARVVIGDSQGVGTIENDDGGGVGMSFSFGPTGNPDTVQWGDANSLLQTNGDATIPTSDDRLRLTEDLPNQAGSAFYNNVLTIDADTSFQSEFTFQLGGGTGADGFVFMLQGEGPTALGDAGGSLGYGNEQAGDPRDEITNSLAIEFDTYQGPWDSNPNHIAVLLNGDVTVHEVQATNGDTGFGPGVDWNNGGVYKAWVDYNVGGADLLRVYIDDANGGFVKPVDEVLTYSVQLDATVGALAYAGFSGATGGARNSHDILEWEMTTSASSPSDFLTLTIDASSISEEAGAAATTATVTRGPGTSGDLTVTLLSSDTTEVTVPATVIIPDTQASVTFDLDAVSDSIVDGTQTVTITATAAGYFAGADIVDVTDDDVGGATIFGTAGADTITPGLVSGGVTGGIPSDGDDTISAGGGNDTVDGGGGADSVDGGVGNDSLIGGAGNDTLRGNFGFDTLDGGGGIDTADISHTSAGPAITLGEEGGANGTVVFGGGTETLISIENVIGSLGDDEITGNSVANDLKGNDGDDLIDGGGGADSIDGGGGADSIDGGNGNDSLIGGAGDDTVRGGFGFDTLDGGDGNDTADISHTSAGPAITLGEEGGANGSVDFPGGSETLIGIENVIGSLGDDVITGNSVANDLQGNDGNDMIDGLGGDDSLDGGAGTDMFVLRAGAGTDEIRNFEDGIDSFVLAGGLTFGTLTITTDSGDALISLTSGGGILARVIGQAGAIGVDDFPGQGGANIVGTAGGDTITPASVSPGVTGGFPSDGDDTIDALGGDDTVDGGGGADSIDGGNGADWIVGGAGDDTLKGGFGYDTLDGGSGIDTADISHTGAGPGITLAEAGLTGSVDFGAGILEELIDIENVIGSLGDDEITGNSVANDLRGNDGNDFIDGLGGADTLGGDAGADRFVLRPGDGIDTIADYVDGTDGFLLDGLVFADLDFVAAGSDTEIQIDATNEVLAIVEDAATGMFDSTDFDPL